MEVIITDPLSPAVRRGLRECFVKNNYDWFCLTFLRNFKWLSFVWRDLLVISLNTDCVFHNSIRQTRFAERSRSGKAWSICVETIYHHVCGHAFFRCHAAKRYLPTFLKLYAFYYAFLSLISFITCSSLFMFDGDISFVFIPTLCRFVFIYLMLYLIFIGVISTR